MNNISTVPDFDQTFLTQTFKTAIPLVSDVFEKSKVTVLTFTTTNTDDYYDDSSISVPPATTTSWQRSIQCFVLVLGLIGTAGNALVIRVLAGKKNTSRRKSTNVLILNLLSVDVYSCVCLVVTYAYKLRNVYLDTSTGDVILCLLLDSEMLLWIGLNSSPASLFFIAAERYAKTVQPVLHRNYFRSWMTYASIPIAWINGILLTAPVTVVTTTLSDGRCEAYMEWGNDWDNVSFGVFYFLWDFLLPSLIFVYCYWHIAIVIRRRVKGHLVIIKGEHNDAVATTASRGDRAQIAGIQTVIIIASLFIVCWLPNQAYFLVMNLYNDDRNQLSHVWYGTLAFAFITVCVHPFIYFGKIVGKYSIAFGRKSPAVGPS